MCISRSTATRRAERDLLLLLQTTNDCEGKPGTEYGVRSTGRCLPGDISRMLGCCSGYLRPSPANSPRRLGTQEAQSFQGRPAAKETSPKLILRSSDLSPHSSYSSSALQDLRKNVHDDLTTSPKAQNTASQLIDI